MLELSVKTRPDVGRGNNKLRKQGLIPAVLYGHKVKNLHLMVNEIELGKLYKKAGENTLVKLKIAQDDKKVEERVVLIQDAVKDPVRGSFVHIDFHQVKMDEVITAEVPLVFVGQSEVIEKEGGLLIKAFQSVEVEALPQNLPHELLMTR
jgi:large subunit ribosomal protein L25